VDGPGEVVLFRDNEPRLELLQATRAFGFDGDAEAFKIASEALRIRLAYLFDPYLAVHSSKIDPLPHQITAVYGDMLPRHPLRFLLADDPGAGKTIMAGLFVKELIIRGDLERCLIVAPGSLVEQWQGGKELEDAEEEIVDRATAAQTIPELEAELVTLRNLEALADRLRNSRQDAKWRQLAEILDKPPIIDERTGQRRKLIIFTEPRDTLIYLADNMRQAVDKSEAVAIIHGGVPRDARRASIVAFNEDPEVRVLVANDAAGEGVNLQRAAHLMVNYDLPWNPNRLEQRFGRIHRIGQTEVCHLWNLVAADTREGEVYGRLLEKLERARAALGGRDAVYDVLGELFQGRPLRELLMEAVLYGDDPRHKQRLYTAVDGVVDTAKIETLIRERKLTSEGLDPRTDGLKARDQAIRAFLSFYKNNSGDFPSDARDRAYEAQLNAAYPVHPELFRILQTNWGGLQKFQKTRGVLKMMAQIVYRLWRDGHSGPVIMPGDVPLRDDKVRANALVPLQSGYDAVLEKEVAGDHCKPAQIEARSPSLGKNRAVTRAASALFMATAPFGSTNKGLEIARLRMACAVPGEQPAQFSEALRRLGETAAYLYNSAENYWFSPIASLNQEAEDRARSLSPAEVEAEIVVLIRGEEKHKGTGFLRVHGTPDEPLNIDDAYEAALVILPPTAWHRGREPDTPAMKLAADIVEHKGAGQRRNRNRLAFLAVEQPALDEIQVVVRKKLAWASIVHDARLLQLPPAQEDDAKKKEGEQASAALNAVRRGWKHLLLPQVADPSSPNAARGFDLEPCCARQSRRRAGTSASASLEEVRRRRPHRLAPRRAGERSFEGLAPGAAPCRRSAVAGLVCAVSLPLQAPRASGLGARDQRGNCPVRRQIRHRRSFRRSEERICRLEVGALCRGRLELRLAARTRGCRAGADRQDHATSRADRRRLDARR
jgi:hypothetical protein